jgi:DnaJ-class molecular chaperone
LTDCPICKATGRVQSRLPFRKKICGECGGTGKQLSGAQRRAASHRSKAELAKSSIPSEELSL